MLKLLRLLKPYTISVAVVLVLMFWQSLSQLYLPTLMSDIVDNGIVHGDINYILRVGGLMLLVAAAGTAAAVVAGFLSAKIAASFGQVLRSKVFARVESFSLNEFNQIGTASLITRTTNDITQVQQVVLMMLRLAVRAPMLAIGGIIMAVAKDAKLSLVIVVVIPVLAVAIFIIAGKGVPLFKKMQAKLDQLNLVLREGLTGIRVIRAFNRIDYEQKRFKDANLDLTDTAVRVNAIMAALMPIMMLILNLTTVAIIWFGSIRIDYGHMQVGDLMAFIQYVMQIMFSLIMLSMLLMNIPRASASAARINELLDMVPEIKDGEPVKSAAVKSGLVEFRNVTYSYPGAAKPAISNISFTAKPGETTAIIGGTGSGKSTLVNLIPRFYDIDSGSILVDGVDIREMAQADLRSQIGLVPQKAVLFSGTIADNIRYGKEDATNEEIKHAAEVAQATEFIFGMKDGFNTVIAQGGTNVSGGQKQRLAVARTLVRKPKIFIFDDCFSALDFKTEAKLRTALKKETVNATVLMVAQRVNSIMHADQIIVLDEGQIAGIGRHKELLRSCRVYREIVTSQLAEEESA
ncbi:Xenobiotic-transporting ATPase [Desulfotomaculum nigrificans CO-1-SRB]|uniref:Xenobiotic-transporting ATPase n=1 Tax=Desulfotomaculum nigrificans (strain DSM 14880 / VKM B-2319 / CO-1-SRB) TaxID=868595 RepID=F6B6W2_DESCC|nr:ABC transporter ATP-binding protein [Desulfotomaculum nigrificans]AEF93287.1 Xenobiotic-transporting ATPase [Desulfotomaculum nigrificans CO-1-SRB]